MSDFSLKAVFGMDGAGFRSDLRQTMNEARSAVNSWASIVSGVGVGALVALSKGAVDLAGHLSDTSANLGINVESLQALEAQHKRNGVSSEELAKALTKVRDAGTEAAKGSAKQVEALAALGINARQFITLPLDKQYAAIGRALAQSTDAGKSWNAVTDIFGEKIGPKMMASLRELGAEGLPKVTEEAKKAGQVLSAETIVALDRAGDAIDDFKKKATVAVGNIIVNFRSEDGLYLLGLQFAKVVFVFGARILDALNEASDFVGYAFGGALIGVANKFRDAMLTQLAWIATQLNKILPSKMQIDIGKIENLKSAGLSIGEEITKAINSTKPSTFAKDVGEVYDKLIAGQQGVVDQLNKVDLGKDAGKLTNAGKEFVKSGVAAATAVVDAGKKAADEITAAFQGGIGRKGADPETLSQTALAALAQNIKESLFQQQRADSTVSGVGFVSAYKSPQQILLEQELARVEAEQNLRRNFARDSSVFGVGYAESNYSPTDFARLQNLAGLVPAQERTNQLLTDLNNTLRERIPDYAFDDKATTIALQGVTQTLRDLKPRG